MSDSENELDMAFIEDDASPEADNSFMVGDLETPDDLTNPTSATNATTTTGGRRRRRRSRRCKSRRGGRRKSRRNRRSRRRRRY